MLQVRMHNADIQQKPAHCTSTVLTCQICCKNLPKPTVVASLNHPKGQASAALCCKPAYSALLSCPTMPTPATAQIGMQFLTEAYVLTGMANALSAVYLLQHHTSAPNGHATTAVTAPMTRPTVGPITLHLQGLFDPISMHIILPKVFPHFRHSGKCFC
eukprot:GHRR01000934.1.p1 GENE.GHRR01000934.1~~GHRR01000934.1.p1  ORF type:complete len:159 (-),score=20.78 GHRR01000934.1:195-671(-)